MSTEIESETQIISSAVTRIRSPWNSLATSWNSLATRLLLIVGIITATSTYNNSEALSENSVNSQQSTECFQITPGEWVKLVHVKSPNYSNTHQEKCPTPVPVSLDPNAPQDRYSQLFNQIATGKASEEEIIEFNTEANKRNTVENDPKIDGLTATPYVIGNTPAEYKQVTGYINNTTRQLVAYFDNGSLVQIIK